MLSKYANVCTSKFFPYSIHGDDFFDSIDSWINEFDLGAKAIRDEKVIKQSMIQSVVANPAFDILKENPKYNIIIESMKTNLGGN